MMRYQAALRPDRGWGTYAGEARDASTDAARNRKPKPARPAVDRFNPPKDRATVPMTGCCPHTRPLFLMTATLLKMSGPWSDEHPPCYRGNRALLCARLVECPPGVRQEIRESSLMEGKNVE